MMAAGVVGAPLGHSLSPQLHGRWIAKSRINGAYVPFAVAPERFETFVEALRGGAVRGVNVTLPFKVRALRLADLPSAAAVDAGSANLLLFHADGRVAADNTDGVGLLYAFQNQAPDHDLTASPVVILGAGGAARGAAAALRAHGVRHLRIVNRTASAAHALAETFDAEAFTLEDAQAALADGGTLINTTSAEMAGSPALDLEDIPAPPDMVVMDMLYRPLRTEFLQSARRRGLKTVDGLDMLIGQAAPSFSAFYGVAPNPDRSDRDFLLAALGEPA